MLPLCWSSEGFSTEAVILGKSRVVSLISTEAMKNSEMELVNSTRLDPEIKRAEYLI